MNLNPSLFHIKKMLSPDKLLMQDKITNVEEKYGIFS